MARDIHTARLAAKFDGEFVVFLIGMRIYRPLLVYRWWPVASAMLRMIRELYRHPELGFLHAEIWMSRTTIMVQYWRSMAQLLAFTTQREGPAPAGVARIQWSHRHLWCGRHLARNLLRQTRAIRKCLCEHAGLWPGSRWNCLCGGGCLAIGR